MSFAFDAREGPIIVRADVVGPEGAGLVRLALDTGATHTLIDAAMLVAVDFREGQITLK